MAIQRSRRLRKKLRIDEFQEIGFSVKFSFADNTDFDEMKTVFDGFMQEVLLPQDLVFEGCGYTQWEGDIHLQKIGASLCTEAHRQSVKDYLDAKGLQNVEVSELFDINWG